MLVDRFVSGSVRVKDMQDKTELLFKPGKGGVKEVKESAEE